MSTRVIEWARNVPVYGKTKEVLENLASTADRLGKTKICLEYISYCTGLLKNQAIDELERLASREIIAVIGEGESFGIPKNIIEMETDPECYLRFNMPVEKFL